MISLMMFLSKQIANGFIYVGINVADLMRAKDRATCAVLYLIENSDIEKYFLF